MVDDADVVLHAGDIKTDEFLDRLASTAMTYAVAGNNDVDMTDPPPDERRLDLAGVPVAMVHDAGPALGRARRMRRRFPDAALVVFGHSHVPVDRLGADGQRLFNPGLTDAAAPPAPSHRRPARARRARSSSTRSSPLMRRLLGADRSARQSVLDPGQRRPRLRRPDRTVGPTARWRSSGPVSA